MPLESQSDYLTAVKLMQDIFCVLDSQQTLRQALEELCKSDSGSSVLVQNENLPIGILSLQLALQILCLDKIESLSKGILPAALSKQLEQPLAEIQLTPIVSVYTDTGLPELLRLAHSAPAEWYAVLEPESNQITGILYNKDLFLIAANLALQENDNMYTSGANINT